MRKNLIILAMLLFSTALYAQVTLAPIYTNDMVIQQDSKVPIWGTYSPGSRVNIIASWAPHDTLRAIANPSGRWSATLTTPKADKRAHTIRVNGMQISNVALGEVWLCSGQSNMEWSVNNGIKDGENEAAQAVYSDIRILKVPLLASEYPQHDVDVTWEVCSPKSMRTASAVGYFFARKLHQELDVPVGIISSAWGGTLAEVWVPQADLQANVQLKGKLSDNTNMWHPSTPGSLYNQMIFPFVPFTLAGVIWYQGESNCDMLNAHPEVYETLMTTMIGAWRKNFAQKLPFYFVQIAPFQYSNENGYAALLRVQQSQVAKNVENTGMVVVSDLVDNVHNIHPKNKQDVGARLAAYALAEVYKHDIANYKSPIFGSVSFAKGRATIEFKNAQSGIVMRGKEAVGLKIAGSGGVFYDAKVKIDGDKVVAWSTKVPTPTLVSYCYDNATVGNLFSGAGLPVAPFISLH